MKPVIFLYAFATLSVLFTEYTGTRLKKNVGQHIHTHTHTYITIVINKGMPDYEDNVCLPKCIITV